VSSWSGYTQAPQDTWQATQVATLNGITYGVTAGNCGSWDCWPEGDTTQLRWTQLTSSGWTNTTDIPNQSTNSKVSLAAFNGYLYMVHTGGSDSSATWISKFNPATQSWSANYQVSYPSFAGPPALVVYNNLLYFIGTSDYPYSMWYATMNAGESFSPLTWIPGHDGASRPSAAVLFGKLYFAHRWGQTGDIVYGTFDGSTWTGATHIGGGNGGGVLQGIEPVLASDAGVLHLLHRRLSDNYVWWTYFDGCKWAGAEVTVSSSSLEPSVTQGGPGLVLATDPEFDDLFGLTSYHVDASYYTRPFSRIPPIVPTCGIISKPTF
jgi:hypothetical protein